MGSCLSKKSSNVSIPAIKSSTQTPDLDNKTFSPICNKNSIEVEEQEDNSVSKKEVFAIKHRKSHDNSSPEPAQICTSSPATSAPAPAAVRTSSCSREELDAILIQCGRLSRSSSGAQKTPVCGSGKKYSGSKRSYDFDNDAEKKTGSTGGGDTTADADDEIDEQRTRQHHRRGSPSPHGRRRTPSRERDRDSLQQQRSGSRERIGVSGGERRVSRSPAKRRAENTGNARPGKIVSVPATVSNGEIKRVSVKRNVMSPRSQSPARVGQVNVVEVLDESHQQHQGLLSRSNSRKGNDNQSPYRRRPLNEISSNVKIVNTNVSQVPMAKPNVEETRTAQDKIVVIAHKGTENHHQNIVLQQQLKPNTTSTESETLNNPQTLTRSRSSRLSRDLDLTPEPTATSSYAALLLEDIQNFHQKHNTAASFTLPPCVTKACSILDAVADLNSCTTSSEKFNSPLQLSANAPFVESEIGALGDDLMEPSLHKYVTMRRGTTTTTNIIGDAEEIESLGSNSVMSGGQQTWEPNSVNSKDGSVNNRDLLDGEKASARRLSGGKKKTRINERVRVSASSSNSRAAAST